MEALTFGPFSLDTSAARLRCDTREITLRPQAYHALRVLAVHCGTYVGYEQLMLEAWHGIVVSRHTVDVTIAEVRKALEEYGSWIRRRPDAGYCLDVPKSDELIRRGRHFGRLRTREGFDNALACFRQAVVVSPTDFRAFEGQAACHLLLAAHGMLPGQQVLAEFLSTFEQAQVLAGLTPELRCMRAQALHLLERRFADARAEFLHVVAERPALALAHVGLANLFVTLGRLDDALASAVRAQELDPLLPVGPTMEMSVRLWRREYDAAIARGARAIEVHPYFSLGRAFYAQALEHAGRLDEALRQYRIASVMSQDLPWVRALEGVCLVKTGRAASARAVCDQLDELRGQVHVDAYAMAVLRHALGDMDDAFAELERAIEEHSVALFAINVDPKADALRASPGYMRLRRRLRDASVRRRHSRVS
jgi:DNA-binding winged helix-turn-helix (wHTH) protein